ncbi:MAG: hypothetical protein NVS4B7_10990 [Ktedonobacteraceae bacterium]
MRFSLQDVKKQVKRQSDELAVTLHFLRPGELQSEIEHLIAYHEQLLGQPRRLFSIDEARAAIADYRLAQCLLNTLSAWYHWQQCPWSEVLERIGNNAHACLEDAGITSPVYLRLALFNFVNAHYCGFLDSQTRPEALQKFALQYQLDVSDLAYLLVLDSDEESILVRATPQLPSAQEVARLYNQWAFEAALFTASKVHFVIDCHSFEQAAEAGSQATVSATMGTGVGAVIKRLCYLARRLGVYYDLAYHTSDAISKRVSARDTSTSNYLHLTLYGPQEMTGAPQQYGLRLARLCRLLLGYGSPQRQYTGERQGSGRQKQGAMRATMLTSAIVEAEATVHFLQRSYRFAIDHAVLSLLPPVETALASSQKMPSSSAAASLVDAQPVDTPTVSSVFDSSIEQSFAEAFAALEQSQAVDSWRLLREPEPLLLPNSIFIPDFALTRKQQRIYVEILGFWTPAYRERKIQKLQQLQERKDIVLAIPVEARDAFARIASSFPIVWYDGQLSAIELLHLLRSHYDDFRERLASIDTLAVRQEVEQKGLLPERTCFELLHCYRRSELLQAAAQVTGNGIVFRAGIGLYQPHWMERLKTSFVEWIISVGELSLTEALRESRVRWPALADYENATIEAILSLWPEVHIHRTSIFEAVVKVVKQVTELNTDAGIQSVSANEKLTSDVPTKKTSREKRAAPKKRIVREAAQGDLWS